jgi:3-oxoacyl-[acyl-carrier protein] reductase
MRLDGRTALVTGASNGLGRATARRLAAEGAEVFIGGRTESQVLEASDEIGAVGHLVSDFTDPASTDALAEAALERLGRIDILVSNTGGPRPGRFVELTDEDWDAAYHLILDSAIRLTRHALPGMMEGGFGRLIYFTSCGVITPLPGLHMSNVMRSGVQALAESLVSEVGPHGVTTHVVAPGHVDTDRRRKLTEGRASARGVTVEEVNAAELATVPVGRFGRAEDIAALVAFLSTDEAGFVTGQTHRADGGFTHVLPI